MALITEDEYSYAGGQLSGCWLKYPGNKNKAKRDQCEKDYQSSKQSAAETDKLLAQAVLNKSLQKDEQMSPLAITGIIVGSLLAITIMVVVIKKVKNK